MSEICIHPYDDASHEKRGEQDKFGSQRRSEDDLLQELESTTPAGRVLRELQLISLPCNPVVDLVHEITNQEYSKTSPPASLHVSCEVRSRNRLPVESTAMIDQREGNSSRGYCGLEIYFTATVEIGVADDIGHSFIYRNLQIVDVLCEKSRFLADAIYEFTYFDQSSFLSGYCERILPN
ncbi:hypothetical protein AMJ40_06875 [candidate division TA06 bacterium DG_26]|uniref:Uncharacterized protein n=1 Tax=candidate division TA06 bacterium DG_26 TaxID=1703771 RepID=A0A0S7WFT2_UNCT6|nr:MAG: hypothetical protein AMJ40_06875 [candidate division TA06 bacterium DG_26]